MSWRFDVGSKQRYRPARDVAAFICRLSRRRAGLVRALEARPGQSLAEFAVALPIFLLLVMAIAGFGIAFEKKISMDNAARSGARYAAVYPDALSPSQPAPSKSIEGQIQNDGSTISIPNDGHGIKIEYLTPSASPGGTPTLCGSYDPTVTNGYDGTGFVSAPGTSNRPLDCMVPTSLIRVTLTTQYSLPVPLLSAVFPNGITIQSSSTMMEEQACIDNATVYPPTSNGSDFCQ